MKKRYYPPVLLTLILGVVVCGSRLQHHELAIEPDRVLLDGNELAKLPAGAAHSDVRSVDRQLTVTADGVPVATTQLGK